MDNLTNQTTEDDIANTQIRSSRETSPRTNREQERFRELLHELSIPIKGETTETNNEDEGSESSISQNLAWLFQKAIKAEKRITQAYQEKIHCWYYYAEQFEKSVKNVKDNDKKVKDQQSRTQVYNAILKYLSNITRENLRKKTQKARNIFKLFSKIGIKKVKRIQSYSADNISKLTGTQIKSIIAHFTRES